MHHTNHLKWFDEYVAGVMYDDRSVTAQKLTLRQILLLKHQRGNPTHENAVVVETEAGLPIGYLRRDLANCLAPIIDRGDGPIDATITELSCDASGSSYRVKIRFSVPSDHLGQRPEAQSALRPHAMEYYFDDSGLNSYVLLNCSEEELRAVQNKLEGEDIATTRNGLCYRTAHNGEQYQWYIRLNKNKEPSRQTLEEFFKKNFNLEPDPVEQEIRQLKTEIDALRSALSRASEEKAAYEQIAIEIDETSSREKERLNESMELLQNELTARECQVNQLEEEKRRSRFQNSKIASIATDRPYDIPDHIAEVFNKIVGDKLTPYESLEVIRKLFPNRIEILPSAWSSAKESKSFKHTKELLELLWKLVTEYWGALASGRSDGEARIVFGDCYAASESERVEKDKRKRRNRTFEYKGEAVEMMRHLKIGSKESVAETLRVHFHWDAVEQKIVIGHCGPHL